MGETTNTSTDKAPKKSFISGLKAEFKKIVWPDQETVTKQIITVLTVAVSLGLMIGVLDYVIKWGLSFII